MTAIVRREGLSRSQTPGRRRKFGLLGSSALVGSVFLAAPALAQNLPVLPGGNPPAGGSVAADGATVSLDATGKNMTVDLNDKSRVVDFNSYNIGTTNKVSYVTADAATKFVAANRVITAGASLIKGTIDAQPNISVWLFNQDGITFSSTAKFSGGSLLVSTLDFADPVNAAFRTAFETGALTTNFQFTGTSTAPIVLGTASLNMTGSIVAVGQNITVDKAIDDSDSSIVLIAATDVTFDNTLGDPLSFTINAGTALGGAVNINANLRGEAVILAGSLKDNLTAALLNVNSAATLTATAAGGAVILATKDTTAPGSTINVVNGLNSAASIATNGKLSATGANGDIFVSAQADVTGGAGATYTAQHDVAINADGDLTLIAPISAGNDVQMLVSGNATVSGTVTATANDVFANVGGDADFAGKLTAGRDVDLTVPGSLAVEGAVSAGRDYVISAGDVTLGTSGSNVVQQAVGAVSIRAITGDIIGNSGLRLASNTSGAGGDLSLNAIGDLNFDSNTALVAGKAAGTPAERSEVVADAGAANLLQLGNVTASSLHSSGNAALVHPLDVTLGNVVVDNALTVVSTTGSVKTGALTVKTAGEALTVRAAAATGDVKTGKLSTNRGNIIATAGRDVITGAVTTALTDPAAAPVAGNVALYAGREVQSGTLNAGEDIGVRAGTTATIAGALAGDDIDIAAAGNVSLANGTTLGTGTGATSIAFGATPGLATAITFGGAELLPLAGATIRLASSGGDVASTGLLKAGVDGDILVDADGDATLTNLDASGGQDVKLTATLGTLTVKQAVKAHRDYIGTGVDVVLGTTGTPFIQQAGRAVTITATGGDISGNSGLTLKSDTDGLGTGDLTLSATGDVLFDANTSLVAGLPAGTVADRSDVIADAGATGTLQLGNVTARSLHSSGDTQLIQLRGIVLGNVVVDNALTVVSQTRSVKTGDVTVKTTGDALTIRAEDAAGDVTTGKLTTTRGNIVATAGRDVTVTGGASTARTDSGTAPVAGNIALAAGGKVQSGALVAGEDIAARAGTTATIASALAGDDIDIAANGTVTLTNGTTLGTGTGTTSIAFGPTPGLATAAVFGGAELPALAGATIQLRSAGADVISSGTLKTGPAGNVFVNAGGNASLGTVNATGGSIGILAGGTAGAASLTAAVDVGVRSGGAATIAAATAGDDIDVATTAGLLTLNKGTALGTGLDGTSIAFGVAGSEGAVGVALLQPAELAGSTIRLISASAGIGSNDTLETRGTGNILAFADQAINLNKVNASRGLVKAVSQNLTIDANQIVAADTIDAYARDHVRIGSATAGTGLTLVSVTNDIGSATSLVSNTGLVSLNAGRNITVKDVGAKAGSVGAIAGGTVTANSLVAAADIAVNAGTGISVTTATARDDIDMVSATGTLNVTNATALGTGGAGTSVVFSGPAGTFPGLTLTDAGSNAGVTAGEDADLAGSSIRLRAAGGDVTSTGLLKTNGTGDILVNAAQNTALATLGAADGSIGVRAGGNAGAASLIASRDIGVRGGSVTVAAAKAGDDIDMVADTGTLSLTDGNSTGLGTGGTSVRFLGAAGTAGAVGIAAGEDPELANASIRLRAAAGDVTSAGTVKTLALGDVLVNAAGNANLTLVNAANGSIGVLAGNDASGTNFTASRDVAVSAGGNIRLATAKAGDDIDMAAGNSLALKTGSALATAGSGGTSVNFGAAGTAGAVTVGSGENTQLAASTIRLRAQTGSIAGDFTTTPIGGTTLSTVAGDILLNAAQNVTVATATANGGSIGILAGQQVLANSLTASRDVGVRGGTGAAVDTAKAGDDIDMVALNGTLSLTDGTSTGLGAGGTSIAFTGAAGAAGAVGVAAGEDPELANASIRLRGAAGNVTSSGTLRTLALGDVLVNAATDANLTLVNAANGSIGVLAGNDASGTNFTASRDVAVSAGGNIRLTTAKAGDDIDMAAGNSLALKTGSALATAGSGGTSLNFGTAGAANAVTVGSGEDAQLAASSIRLRAQTGSIAGDFTTTPIGGTTLSTVAGDILLNAAQNVTVATATANGGSIGILAGQQALANSLTASRDIGVQGGTGVTVTTAKAGDDIDMVALTGTLSLRDGTSTGAGVGVTSVAFTGPAGAAGAVSTTAPESAQLAGKTIRLRAQAGKVLSAGKLETDGTGDILVNAADGAALTDVEAKAGSIGVLSGKLASATTLTASRDVGVQGNTGVSVTTATAGDDIDMVALTGTLSLTDGTSTGLGAGGSSVTFGAVPGADGAIGIGAGEDAELANASIRLRAATGNVASSGTLATRSAGDILVNAGTDAGLATVQADAGSIGVLAGHDARGGSLTAAGDIAVGAGNDAALGTAIAGDDIDVAAGNDLALANGSSLGTAGAGGSSVTLGTAGAAHAVTVGAGEDAQLAGATIRLRAQGGSIAGDFTATPLAGATLTTAAGDILLNAAQNVTVAGANATGGSIGILAGGQVGATSLTASNNIGIEAGSGLTVTTAIAGDDIDMTALSGTLSLQDGTSTGAGTKGTAVTFSAAPGIAGAVGVTAGEDAELAASSIRLRAAAGNVASAGTLRTDAAGDILVNAAADAALGTAHAAAGSIGVLAGNDASAADLTAGTDVAVSAGHDARIVLANAGDDIDILAANDVALGTGSSLGTAGTGGTSVTFGSAGAAHGVIVGAPEDAALGKSTIRLRATGGSIAGDFAPSPVVGTNLTAASGDILLTAKQNVALAAATANADGSAITVEGSDLTITGAVTANTNGRITLRNTGASSTVVGTPATTTGAAFGIDNAELDHLTANSVVIDAIANKVELGTMTVKAETGSGNLRFLSTGDIEITGPVTVAGTGARLVQIGGAAENLSGDPLPVDPAAGEKLASTIVARINANNLAKIIAGSATVEFRGAKVLFGSSAMVDSYLAKTDAEIAKEVSDRTSLLFFDASAESVDTYLTAKQVNIAYHNFALFQNTLRNSSRGVAINSPEGGAPDPSALAIRLISTGDIPPNSIAMFGKVNGLIGTTAASLGNAAIEITNPAGVLRINLASSRLNGCVIGSPEKGCLSTDVPQPNFDLYDERKVALFDATDDATIAVSPLIGRGNDGLIVNIADAPVGIDTIDCKPDDANCHKTESQ